MTYGQELALLQLQQIADVDDYSLEVEEVIEPNGTNPLLQVKINISIGPVERVVGGLPLRQRERFTLRIPPSFPIKKAEVQVEHNRFAGWPHVQWIHHLCLYQSETEWNPSDGIFGLITRLEYWLRQGAKNQLDPQGEPLHPPAVYAGDEIGKLVIPRRDTPAFDGAFWIGIAEIKENARFIEINGWHGLDAVPANIECAVTILFSSPLPWEYPSTGIDLFLECESQGVSQELLFGVLKLAGICSKEDNPIYIILGSPMRGIAGGERKQHLSVWAIPPKTARDIRASLRQTNDSAPAEELRTSLQTMLIQRVSWCRVIEDRPELTVRRDQGAAVSFFRGKTVAMWGCGALGGNAAILLARAGVKKLILYDKGIVTPGILVRQPYVEGDIAEGKAEALANHLRQISKDLEIEPRYCDLERLLSDDSADWRDGSDVVIDATASDAVRRRVEILWKRGNCMPLAAMMIDRTAQQLMTAVVGTKYPGAAWHVWRNTKIELLLIDASSGFADGFFPSRITDRPFQPEPGCSEPTFIGSAADSSALAAIGLNLVATDLSKQPMESAVSHLFAQPTTSSKSLRFEFDPDFVIRVNDYDVRITQAALHEMKAWISSNRRVRKRTVETGGLLWGEWDDATRIVWVTDASGPPPDSYHAETKFVCGVEGTREEHDRRSKFTRGAVGYVGMWHTHPISEPWPSEIDLAGMHQILTEGRLPPHRNLLFIVGKDSGRDALGVYLFRTKKGDAISAVHELRTGRMALLEHFL